MMYLSKIEFIPSQWQRIVTVLNQGAYHEHQMVWDLLPKDESAERDFLYRREEGGALPFYYLLSSREPVVEVDFLHCATRPYAPLLQAGDVLQFSLRANAVKTLLHEGARRRDTDAKQRKRRGIVEAKAQHYHERFPNPDDRPSTAQICHEAGQEWLVAQGEKGGFQVNLDALRVENQQFHELRKPHDPNVRQFASLDFRGELQVTDAEVFTRDVLFKGLGRSKAFGCGLLLVKRV